MSRTEFSFLSHQRLGTSSHHRLATSQGIHSFYSYSPPPQAVLASLVTQDDVAPVTTEKELFLPCQFFCGSADRLSSCEDVTLHSIKLEQLHTTPTPREKEAL